MLETINRKVAEEQLVSALLQIVLSKFLSTYIWRLDVNGFGGWM